MTQEVKNENIEVKRLPVIGERAPEFTANTTHGVINFPQDYEGRWVILFSHPADFTPVCTTEFMTFASMQDEFKALNTELIGLSVDSVHAHLGWVNAMTSYEWKDIKNPAVGFPVIDDVSMNVSNKYGMVHGKGSTSAVRAVFFVDPNGNIRTIMYYPAELGRNFDEIKRVILGLQKHDADKVALPANWKPGEDVIVPAPSTTDGISKRIEEGKQDGYNQVDWYLTFKKDK